MEVEISVGSSHWGEMGYEQFLSIFSQAREAARMAHEYKSLFSSQRAYFELGCLDEVLSSLNEDRFRERKSK